MTTPNVVTYLDSTPSLTTVDSVTTGSLPKPTTLADGDFLLAVVSINRATLKTLTLPTAWTQERSAGGTGSFDQLGFYFVWHRVVTAASEPASYTFDWTGQGAASFSGLIHRFAGVSTTAGPWAGSNVAYSSNATVPSLTYTCTTAGQGIWAYAALNQNLTVVVPPTYTKRSTLYPSGRASYTVADRPDQPGTLSTGTGTVDVSDGQVVFAGTLLPAHVNAAPTADAGLDVYAEPNDEVFLTGVGADAEGVQSVRWTQTAGPTVQIYGLGSTVSFYAPAVLAGTDLTFQLTVTDTSLATATDTKVVHVAPPTLRKLQGGVWQPTAMLLCGVEQPNVPSADIATLTQTFNDLAGFTEAGGLLSTDAQVVGGRLQIAAITGYPSVVSNARYDLTNSAVYAQLVTAPNVGQGTIQTFLNLVDAGGDNILIGWSGGNLLCNQTVGGTTVGSTLTYTSGVDVWLRISHDGTNLIWATSPDKVTWTTKRTAAPAVPLTRLQVAIMAGTYTAETGGGNAVWDNLNS